MFRLKSAVEYGREDEYSHIPSYATRKSVEVGQKVRLIVQDGSESNPATEFLWFEVTARSVARYTGQLLGAAWNYRDQSSRIRSAKKGVIVNFLPRHIYKVSRR